MKKSWRTWASLACYMIGSLGWIYFGAWMIWTKIVKGLILAYTTGDLTIGNVGIAALQIFLYLSFAGAVWCVGYILSNRLKRNE